VPIILNTSEDLVKQGLTQVKFLVSQKLTLAQFRRQLADKVSSCKYVCYQFFINGSALITLQKMTMGEMWREWSDPDGFLYLQLRDLEAFGGLF
jgi:hypothetical protein